MYSKIVILLLERYLLIDQPLFYYRQHFQDGYFRFHKNALKSLKHSLENHHFINKWRTFIAKNENLPWLTRSCLDISQGRTPISANSTILLRTQSGSGLRYNMINILSVHYPKIIIKHSPSVNKNTSKLINTCLTC